MNLLFVIKKETYGNIEPLGIMYLSSVLNKNGHNVFLSDTSLKRVSALIKEKDIRIVGFSCANTEYEDYVQISRKIKERFPSVLIIWGGPTPTFRPEIIAEDSIDIICRGEGEAALLELVDRLEHKQVIHDIANLWIKDGARIYKNDVRPLLADLDSLPLPDRSLINAFPQFRYSPLRFMMASRGCPYNCSYCFNHSFHELYRGKGKIIRIRSVDNVIAELEELKKDYNAKFFYFQDDIFPSDDNWLISFSEKYSRIVKVPFTVVTSARFITDKFVRYLTHAGCISLHIAIECGNEKIRTEILNKPITNQQIIDAIKIVKQHKLGVASYNMVGVPFSTFGDDVSTLDFNLKVKIDAAYVFFYLPFLETKLGKLSKDGGLLDGNTEFLSYFEKITIKVENKQRLEKFSYLFPIIVTYPFLRRYLSILLKIPFPRLFLKFLKDFINAYIIKRKSILVKLSFTEFCRTGLFLVIKRFSR